MPSPGGAARDPGEQRIEMTSLVGAACGPHAEPGAGAPDAAPERAGGEATESAARRWGARLALLALSVAAVGGPAARWHRLTRACPDNEGYGISGQVFWQLYWPLYAVCAPASLAFAAWCVAVRRRIVGGVPLHAWTGRFGVCAALHAGCLLAWPGLSLACPVPLKREQRAVTYALALLTYYATEVVQWNLLVLRLRSLGRPLLAAAAWVALLPGAVGAAGVVLTEAAGTALVSTDCSNLLTLLSQGLFHACQSVGFSCGAWGLLTSAARAAHSGRAGASQVACWVGMAGVLALASLVLSLTQYALDVGHYLYFDISLVFPQIAAWACDEVFNCFSAALLSGLVGPHNLRRLAEEAFERINTYDEDQLQEFYLEYLDYLDEAQVKWIRCGYLRRLAEVGATMVRCQEVPPAEAIVGSLGFPRARDDPNKHRFVLSHPWLSKQHPDPSGVKLKVLVQQLNLLGASDDAAIFIDYMGLPQHNKQDPEFQRLEREDSVPKPGEHPVVRTQVEEALFKKALGSMELLYSMGKTPVIVLPMDDDLPEETKYFSRGWCFFELCLALSFDNVANAKIHAPVEQMCKAAADLKANTVEGFQEGFKATRFTSKGDQAVVFKLFKQTLNKRARH